MRVTDGDEQPADDDDPRFHGGTTVTEVIALQKDTKKAGKPLP
ncbi:hypothetical protein [Microbacterium sp. YY-01]